MQMDMMLARCAGLDVHKDNVVACVRLTVDGQVTEALDTFSTTTKGLVALHDWLDARQVTHVAMEATGIYWKPVWHILEGSFELLLANATHVKNVPGRKSDVQDAAWIAKLLAHGLLRGSFVPPTPIQELRDLTRTRKQLVRETGQHVQRIHKVLEDANLKITRVMSDVTGTTGRLVLDALIRGQTDPERLVELCGRLRASKRDIVEALRGQVTQHHRFLLHLHLKQLESLEQSITSIEQRLGDVLGPFRSAVELLTTIPGISDVAANAIVSEIGFDMTRFRTAGHLVSWAGLCPRSDESAGKHRSTRIRHGSPWLKTVLVQCGWAASRKKDSSFMARFLRLRARCGPKKAVVAVAAALLRTVYGVLQHGSPYRELGANYLDARTRTRRIRRAVKCLESLGVKVRIEPAA
jgi:transposase